MGDGRWAGSQLSLQLIRRGQSLAEHMSVFTALRYCPRLPIKCSSIQWSARFDTLEEVNFKTDDKNPLTELSELRFEISQTDPDFELICRLRFGKMHYEHNEREYEVGVSRAHLRLSLEGCETTLGSAFGESVLNPVVEEDEIEAESSVSFELSAGASSDTGANAKANARAGAGGTRKRKMSQSNVHLPVVARPNDSWEVQPTSVTGTGENIIEGTAIPSVKLCVLRRKRGGNRIAIVGEVQISKSAMKVSAKGGNRLGKALNEWQNKDAIVSQILKRAIQREATIYLPGRLGSTVVISRCEVMEK